MGDDRVAGRYWCWDGEALSSLRTYSHAQRRLYLQSIITKKQRGLLLPDENEAHIGKRAVEKQSRIARRSSTALEILRNATTRAEKAQITGAAAGVKGRNFFD